MKKPNFPKKIGFHEIVGKQVKGVHEYSNGPNECIFVLFEDQTYINAAPRFNRPHTQLDNYSVDFNSKLGVEIGLKLGLAPEGYYEKENT